MFFAVCPIQCNGVLGIRKNISVHRETIAVFISNLLSGMKNKNPAEITLAGLGNKEQGKKSNPHLFILYSIFIVVKSLLPVF